MNWRDSIWVQDSVTRRHSQSVLKLRSVSFPIQRTRVTRVTRDVSFIINNIFIILWNISHVYILYILIGIFFSVILYYLYIVTIIFSFYCINLYNMSLLSFYKVYKKLNIFPNITSGRKKLIKINK